MTVTGAPVEPLPQPEHSRGTWGNRDHTCFCSYQGFFARTRDLTPTNSFESDEACPVRSSYER